MHREMSSFEIESGDVPKAFALLSVERMAVLRSITGDDRDAIELHQQMLVVGAAMMPVMAILEICLRNAVSERLRTLFGTPDWLQAPPLPFAWRDEEKQSILRAKRHAQRALYTKKSQHEKRRLDRLAHPNGLPPGLSHEQRVRNRQHQIQITLGQLVAQLTLVFWKRLFSNDYQSALWDRSLKKIFPDKSIGRSKVAESLEVIYQARNRIAHHEPLYGDRLTSAIEAIDFIVGKFGPKTVTSKTLIELMIKPHRDSLDGHAAKLAQMISRYTIRGEGQ